MSYDIVKEDVPPFVKRVNDYSIQGSNNTIIIMGTDRASSGPADLSDGLGSINSPGGGKGAGSIHIISGRNDPKGNPDLKSDDSYLYLSRKTEVDKNLGLGSVEKETNGGPAAILTSDSVRVIYRKDLKISISDGKNYIQMDGSQVKIKVGQSFVKIEDGKIVIDAGDIELGEGASERLVLGDSFKQYFMLHGHPSPVGPTGPPIQPFPDTLLSQRTVKAR